MGVVGVGVVAGLVWMRIEVYMVTMVVFGKEFKREHVHEV